MTWIFSALAVMFFAVGFWVGNSDCEASRAARLSSPPMPADKPVKPQPRILWGASCFAEYLPEREGEQPWKVQQYVADWGFRLDREDHVIELMRRLDSALLKIESGMPLANGAASNAPVHISMQEKRIAQLRDELAHAEELRQAFVATLNTAGDFLKRVLDEDRSVLQRERELSDQLAAALKHVKWVLQKHHDSAVLIRNGDIELATIKPHCAIRKGSAAYRFATAALAQYAAIRRGPENDKACEGQASAGEPTK